jgi:4-carboxymuconolactone decarboxylase
MSFIQQTDTTSAFHGGDVMKTLVTGFLTIGAMMLVGAEPTPARAQGSAAAPPVSSAAGTVQPSPAQRLMGDIAPKLAELTDNVLFGDVWERPQLSKRDRSLVTVSALIAMNRPDQLRSHLARARENGVTEEELVETITHLAFYAGWPNAVTAVSVAREVFKK